MPASSAASAYPKSGSRKIPSFTIDGPVLTAIDRYHGELARSAPARLMEEIYKVLRAGAAEKTFRMLVETGLLAALAPEVPGRITETFWQSLRAVDEYRRAFKRNPESLGNAILLGSLLIPLARRDVEFLRQILMLQRHLRDHHASPRHKRGVMHRSAFPAALMWLELHGNAPALVESWRALQAQTATEGPEGLEGTAPASDMPRRRRRRRRRRKRFPTP
jgi:poly(A) polymerase